LKGGIGDPKEIDAEFDGLKTKASFLFAANGASGSGANGSQINGGSGKTITRSQYEANPTAYATQLAAKELTITD
jgi:hypothetical protein